MNITANAASLDWRTNNHGVWKALVKDMAPDSSVTFSGDLTGTVAGRQVTVESPSMPTGFMTYTTDDDTAVSGGVLYGAGTVSDSLEAVSGGKTVRMGGVDLGTLTWKTGSTQGYFYCDTFSAIASGVIGMVASSKLSVLTTSWESSRFNSYPDNTIGKATGNKILYVKCMTFTNTQAVDFKTYVSGVILYYELATPTTSTETAQPMSLAQGSDTIGGGSFSATYEGTEYEIIKTRNRMYIHRDISGHDTLLNRGSSNTTISVKGGVSKLIDLSRWFGYSYEPTSLDAFYRLYPTWKNYDIPYIEGQFVNYKGTGVQTIGFNAYNHATGTAELLGGNKYQICGTYTSVSYVNQWGDTEELELDSEGIFTPTNNGVLTVVGGNSTDTCVHLCWSGYKNFGEKEYQWEPFVKNVHNIGILEQFADGMNGIDGVYDELRSDSKTQNIKKIVFTGEETFNASLVTGGYYAYKYSVADRLLGRNKVYDVVCNMLSFESAYSAYGGGTGCICFNGVNDINLVIVPPVAWGSFATSSNVTTFKAKLKELYDAGNPLVVYYISKTPVVTQLPSPINLTYPVNDFGTEQSLPVNTTDLVTTDLHALIRYNTDYMRMNTQLSEIFPTVRSLAQQEQDGEIMKTDATAPNATVGNAYNLIDRNAAGTERQFSFDTSGGTQDIADGTAVAKKVMGTTLNLNQLVHDTNENVVTGEGQVEVEDAVAGDVASLIVEGRSLVKNQLVPSSVEKTGNSNNGVVEVADAVAGDAKGLVMTAPRSVVVNQQAEPPADYTSTNNGVTRTCASGYWTFSGTSAGSGGRGTQILKSLSLVAGHTYLMQSPVMPDGWWLAATSDGNKYYKFSGNSKFTPGTAPAKLLTASGAYSLGFGYLTDASYDGISGYIQIVDLTQYFNGDQTLIDRITSWDDLVAYDPRFASYVEYNTGTVTGVQPTVKVTGKNLLNPQIFLDNGGVLQSDGSYYFATSSSMATVRLLTQDVGQITLSGEIKYTQSESNTKGITIIIWYTDGSYRSTSSMDLPADGSFHSFSVVSDASKTVDYITCSYVGANVETWLKKMQIELGSTATAYEPYHDGGTATAPELFGLRRVSDTHEVVSGITTRRVGKSVDLGTLDWDTITNAFRAYIPDSARHATGVITGAIMTNGYTEVAGQPPSDGTFAINSEASLEGVLRVRASSYATVDAFKTAMSGVYLYYELATPVEEQGTPASIALQAGSNVAMQTDGGRTTPFSLTYDGTEFTLQLDSTHKYAFSDNGVKSVLTGSTEQAVTGGQDMLVDVTRMFNGDATAINAITSWNEMAAVMPEYLSNVAYNEGEVVARGGTITTAVWNQLQDIKTSDASKTASNVTITDNRNGTYTVSTTSEGATALTTINLRSFTLGHKILYTGAPAGCTGDTYGLGNTGSGISIGENGRIVTTTNGNNSAYFGVKTGCILTEPVIFTPMFFDLTEIYGAGHEPSTVEEFEADCAKWGKDLSQYQPYDVGTPMGGSATFSGLHGVGTAKDTLDVVTGEKTVKIGSYTFTGEEAWTLGVNSGVSYNSYWFSVSGKKNGLANLMLADFTTSPGASWTSLANMECIGASSGASVYIKNDAWTTPEQVAAGMAGKTVYYELAEPITSTETAQPLTFAAGLNNVHEENMDITGTPVTMEYTGTDYAIATKSASVYLKNIAGTVERVTGVSSIAVRGGRDNVIDLTRMFGASLEPGTVADFYKLFPAWRGYKLPYNEGSLLNFKGTGLKSVGFNQFSGEYSEEGRYLNSSGALVTDSIWEVSTYLRAIPEQVYRLTAYGNAPSICWYTYDKTFISGTNYGHASVWQEDVFTAPANAYWVRFSVLKQRANEVCFYFQWSGTRNGDYEPYWDYTRPVPTLTYFPDGMNGRGGVYDEINDRQAIRRFGVVDLGTLSWTWTTIGGGLWYTDSMTSTVKKPSSGTIIASMVSSNYVAIGSSSIDGSVSNEDTIAINQNGRIWVNNGSATESPSGWLVYELATPVVTTFSEEISTTARISDYGTEECLPVNGYDPVTAPFRGMVLYQDDYARTITKLPENYQSQDSMNNLLALLGQLHNGTISTTFDAASQSYKYNFTPNA